MITTASATLPLKGALECIPRLIAPLLFSLAPNSLRSQLASTGAPADLNLYLVSSQYV